MNPPSSQQNCQQHSPNGPPMAICESPHPHHQTQLPAESHQRCDLSLSARVFRSLAASDVESLIIIRQCRFLESALNSNFTSTILTSSEDISLPSMKKEILQLDLSLLLSNAASHPSQKFVQAVASSQEGSWLKIWDLALERGVFGTTCTQAVLRALSLHSVSDNTSPVPNCSFTLGSESPCAHFLSAHTDLNISVDVFVEGACCYCSDCLFLYGKSLYHCYKSIWNH